MRRLLLIASILLAVPVVSGAQRTRAIPRFTARDFAQLRWIAGDWRGAGRRGTRQTPFFERYRFPDDSTLVVESFTDSTWRTVRDAARYELRGGWLTNVGMTARYVAVRLDSIGVEFAPVSGAQNHFRWDRAPGAGPHPSTWQATILWVGPTAVGRWEYQMRRVR